MGWVYFGYVLDVFKGGLGLVELCVVLGWLLWGWLSLFRFEKLFVFVYCCLSYMLLYVEDFICFFVFGLGGGLIFLF